MTVDDARLNIGGIVRVKVGMYDVTGTLSALNTLAYTDKYLGHILIDGYTRIFPLEDITLVLVNGTVTSTVTSTAPVPVPEPSLASHPSITVTFGAARIRPDGEIGSVVITASGSCVEIVLTPEQARSLAKLIRAMYGDGDD
jgi:hypothetical protein